MNRFVIVMVVCLAPSMAALICHAKDAAPRTQYQVAIENFTFAPATLTVPAGTTVTWTNRDDMPHLVVIPDGKQRSAALDTDQSFSYTFSRPGTYAYFCGMHPKMTGTVVVKPPAK
jgi:plastocyanin